MLNVLCFYLRSGIVRYFLPTTLAVELEARLLSKQLGGTAKPPHSTAARMAIGTQNLPDQRAAEEDRLRAKWSDPVAAAAAGAPQARVRPHSAERRCGAVWSPHSCGMHTQCTVALSGQTTHCTCTAALTTCRGSYLSTHSRTTHHSPRTTHHSPLTTHHSPLTTHHSPLTALCRPPPPTCTRSSPGRTRPCRASSMSSSSTRPPSRFVTHHTNMDPTATWALHPHPNPNSHPYLPVGLPLPQRQGPQDDLLRDRYQPKGAHLRARVRRVVEQGPCSAWSTLLTTYF